MVLVVASPVFAQRRHYYFEEAEVEIPYRLYVPEGYDPAVPTPLLEFLARHRQAP